ncbi:MAG: M23 family metallopeptidase [Acidobacteria bacterium]|nr:M23 family metallopeptidase [Acidobacteriota bacterium]
MGLKYHTVIFVPHARARFRKWKVTNRQLHIAASVAFLLAAGSVFTTWSFFTNSIDRNRLEQVTSENENLREINRSFEASVNSLQSQLAEFEAQTRQLAIVAGLDGFTTALEAGIGGVSSPIQAPNAGVVLEDLDDRASELAQALVAVEVNLDERRRLISATPSIAPVKGILTSRYGYRRDPITGNRAPHWAIDIGAAPGQAVQATADGVVVRAGRIGNLGNAVYVAHGFGITTRYGHLSKVSVQAGDRVSQRDTLGLVGNTGRSTGYHLHYEVRVDGRPENPRAYILDGTSAGH